MSTNLVRVFSASEACESHARSLLAALAPSGGANSYLLRTKYFSATLTCEFSRELNSQVAEESCGYAAFVAFVPSEAADVLGSVLRTQVAENFGLALVVEIGEEIVLDESPDAVSTFERCLDAGFQYVRISLEDLQGLETQPGVNGRTLLETSEQDGVDDFNDVFRCHMWSHMERADICSSSEIKGNSEEPSSPILTPIKGRQTSGEPDDPQTSDIAEKEEGPAQESNVDELEEAVQLEALETLMGKMKQARGEALSAEVGDTERRKKAADLALEMMRVLGLDEDD